MPPTSDEQIRFLGNVQRLLDEGSFVASYEFALLLALADISIEHGDDSGAPMIVEIEDIADNFIDYYWRQAVPYSSPREARVLQQNTGKQAAIVNLIREARETYGDSLTRLMRERVAWTRLVRQVAGIVRIMPLWKLQTIGQERIDFLYENGGGGRVIELRPGVAYCFASSTLWSPTRCGESVASVRSPPESRGARRDDRLE